MVESIELGSQGGIMKFFLLGMCLTLLFLNGIRKHEIAELRKDVNRVSNIQLRCSVAIERGYYTGEMWAQCIDDYLHSGIKGQAPS